MQSQLLGSLLGLLVALLDGVLIYGLLKVLIGTRLNREEVFIGADLSIHRIGLPGLTGRRK